MDYLLKDILPVAIDRVHFSKYCGYIGFSMRKVKISKSGRFGVLNMDEINYLISAISNYLDDKYHDKPLYIKARVANLTTLNFYTMLKNFSINSLPLSISCDLARKMYQSTINYIAIFPDDILVYGISKKLYPNWNGWSYIGSTPLEEAILDYKLYILVKDFYENIWNDYIKDFNNQNIASIVWQLMLENTPYKAIKLLRHTLNPHLNKDYQKRYFTKQEIEYLNTLNTKQINSLKSLMHHKNAKFKNNALTSKIKDKD